MGWVLSAVRKMLRASAPLMPAGFGMRKVLMGGCLGWVVGRLGSRRGGASRSYLGQRFVVCVKWGVLCLLCLVADVLHARRDTRDTGPGDMTGLRDKVRAAERGTVSYPPGKHPRTIAALEAHRFKLRWDLAPACARCRRRALRGRLFCGAHNGREGGLRVTPGVVASRGLARLSRLGLLPRELMALATWQALSTCQLEQRAPLRMALALAWDTRDTAPLQWAALWRQACDLAAHAPPPAPWRKRGVPLWQHAR